MESQKRPLLTLWGIYFACTGFATAVAGLASWHFGGGLPLLPAAYLAMNFLISRAFFLRERWLFPFLALHFTAYSILILATWVSSGHVQLLASALSTALAAGALATVYFYRPTTTWESTTWTGAICLTLWILVYTYSVSMVLQ